MNVVTVSKKIAIRKKKTFSQRPAPKCVGLNFPKFFFVVSSTWSRSRGNDVGWGNLVGPRHDVSSRAIAAI